MKKACAYCKERGPIVRFNPDTVKMQVKCSKCGFVLDTPYLTVDGAIGFWNTHMKQVEEQQKTSG